MLRMRRELTERERERAAYTIAIVKSTDVRYDILCWLHKEVLLMDDILLCGVDADKEGLGCTKNSYS